jgi:hypothetical protein
MFKEAFTRINPIVLEELLFLKINEKNTPLAYRILYFFL